MALDATVGGASANAYDDADAGDIYFGDRLFATGWTGAAAGDKDAALIMATRAIDSLCYRGTAASKTQALQFPRTGLTLPSGYGTKADEIPTLIKHAMFEHALILLNASSDTTLEKEQFAEGLRELRAGPVTLKFREEFDYRAIPGNVRALIPDKWICETEVKKFVFSQI